MELLLQRIVMFRLNYSKLKVSGHILFLSKAPCRTLNSECTEKYINFLNENKIKTIVILLESSRYTQKVFEIYKENNINYIHYPIRDFSIPRSYKSFHKFMKQISDKLKKENILIHCAGGHGRTGMVAAGLAVYKRRTPSAAITLIRKARPGSIETREQEWFIENYSEYISLREEIRLSSSQF